MAADTSRSFDVEQGVLVEGTYGYVKVGRELIYIGENGSQKITYLANGDIDFVEFFVTASQVTGNRKAKCVISYTSGDPTTETWSIYDTDGTTVLQEFTYTYSYSGGNISTMSEASA